MERLFRRILHTADDGGELPEERVDRVYAWIDTLDVKEDIKELLEEMVRSGGSLPERYRGRVLYGLINGSLTIPRAIAHTGDRAVCAAMEQYIIDKFQISQGLAEEFRQQVFTAAAQYYEHREPAVYHEMIRYGGMK